jgi:hypothetical protein
MYVNIKEGDMGGGDGSEKSDRVATYRNWFVTQYITYLNIWDVLSGTLSPLSNP